jgi:D-arabinose 5-phosphate isomerase GutQ
MNRASFEKAKQAFHIEAQSILATGDGMDEEVFSRVVDVLKKAPRIAASGCGHSGIACMHFAHLMCCIEKPARFIPPSEATHGGMGFVQAGDVLLLVSRGGKTAELLPIARIARDRQASIILLTESPASELAQLADMVLLMNITRETDRHNSQGTTSFAVTNAIFDAIQTALIEETGFMSNHFAQIHPGGAVGERLNKQPGADHRK